MNPSLSDELSASQTVAVGCSLTRAALGASLLSRWCPHTLELLTESPLHLHATRRVSPLIDTRFETNPPPSSTKQNCKTLTKTISSTTVYPSFTSLTPPRPYRIAHKRRFSWLGKRRIPHYATSPQSPTSNERTAPLTSAGLASQNETNLSPLLLSVPFLPSPTDPIVRMSFPKHPLVVLVFCTMPRFQGLFGVFCFCAQARESRGKTRRCVQR